MLSACGAGWNTDIWPSTNYFRNTRQTNAATTWTIDFVGTNKLGVVTTNEYIVLAQAISNDTGIVYDNVYSTNIVMDTKDLWAWDCFQAINERINDCDMPGWSFILPYSINWWRDERANLVAIKDWLNSYTDDFELSVDDWATPLTVTGVCATIGAPTNWCDWTPWRQLNGSGSGYGRVITNTFIMPGAGTNQITNTVYNSWGGTNTFTNFPGYTNTVTVTNESILSGFTSLDYGWKYAKTFINQLHTTKETAAFWYAVGDAKTNYLYWVGDNTNTWAAAKTSAEADTVTASHASGMYSFTKGTYSAGPVYRAYADLVRNGIEATGMSTTGIGKVVFYLSPAAYDTNFPYADQGTGWSADTWQAVATNNVTNAATCNSGWLVVTNFPPDWCAEPNATTNPTYTGFNVAADKIGALVEWLDGFDYQ